MVAVRSSKNLQHRLSRQRLQGRGGIDQPPVEEHPSGMSLRGLPVCKGHRDGPACKRRRVHPWKSPAAVAALLCRDPAPGLVDDRVAASPQRGEKRRLAAARTARDHHEVLAQGGVLFR